MEESVFMDGVRGVMATIDRAVYGLISVFYDTIITLSDTTIIGSDKISEITNKVYALIAIFMIFKISFSLINYLVNPDMIVDKTKGGGMLVKNVIITFILVITVPFGFDLLYRAQSAIISDGIIEKLIYGGETVNQGISFKMDDDYCGNTSATAGNYVGLMAFKTFFQLDDQAKEDDRNEILTMYCNASVTGERSSVNDLLKNNKVYSAPHGFTTQHYYVVDYSFFLSTIVGIVLALVFLGFCFDVATRSIKLQFLEILAPIPIISYIDPDKSKSGIFSKWIKEVATTWLSLFMRLIAYHIAIYFISTLHENASLSNNLWINLLIIIGILMFAKELPKLLENIIGIKASGSFNLNPLKKLDEQALGFKAGRNLLGKTAAATAAVGMSAVGSANRYKARKKRLAEDDAKLQTKYDDILKNELNEAETKMKKQMLNYQKLDAMGIPGMKEKIRNEREAYNNEVAGLIDQNARKLAEEKSKMRKFSDNHPIFSGVTAAGRASSEAFKADHKSIQSIIDSASKAATNSAKERTYRDSYGIGDRAMNKVTDWGDVRKSGTADVVDRRVKELNDQLTQVTNALDSLRQEQSTFAPGTFTWATSGPNAGQMSVSSSVTDPNTRALAEENVRLQQELQQTVKDLNSEIKAQNKILEQSKK